MEYLAMERGNVTEFSMAHIAGFQSLNFQRVGKESTSHLLERVKKEVSAAKIEGLMQWVWGGIDPKTKKNNSTVAKYVRECGIPTQWLVGDGVTDQSLTAIQIFGIDKKKAKTQAIAHTGGTFRKSYSDEFGTYSYVGGPIGMQACVNAKASQTEQTEAAFEAVRALCKLDHQTTFKSVVRTWIYLDKLLTWYDPFNVVRTNFFKKLDLFNKGMIPSSTGIGAANFENAAINLSAFTVVPKTKAVSFKPVASPLQCPAVDYKSSFSRAHVVTHPEYRQMLISGTASIFQGGESAYVGDIAKQIELTMQVVEGMLKANKFRWGDTLRAICYFKDIKDVKVFKAWMEANDIDCFPMIAVQCDVCRDELLFEIELDLIQAK